MSAFQLPDTHIGAIARFAIDQSRGAQFHCYYDRSTHRYDFEDICTVLAAECYRSVRARYPTGPLPGPSDAGDGPVVCHHRRSEYAKLAPVDVLKALRSYEYQSCETGDFETTEAYALVQAITATAIRALPGFDGSPAWEVDYTEAEQAASEADARRQHHASQAAQLRSWNVPVR